MTNWVKDAPGGLPPVGARPDRAPHVVLGWSVATAFAAVVVASATVAIVEAADLPGWLVIALALVAVGYVSLAAVRYDVAVAVALLLQAVVEIEPAPPDAAFAALVAIAVLTGRFHPGRSPLVITAAIGSLLLLNLVSTLVAVQPSEALQYATITAYLAISALWFAGWVRSQRRARIVVVTWTIGATLSAAVGLALVYLPVDIPGRAILMDRALARPDVLFQDANVYGPFLVPIAAILLEERLRPRLLGLSGAIKTALFLLLSGGVLVSFSRAAWINLVVAVLVTVVVLAMRRDGARAAIRTLVILGLGLLAGLGVLAATGGLSFLETRARLQTYDSERFGAQWAGVELAVSHPLGVGPGQFQFYHPVEAHSTYVRVLAEQGLLGLLVWLALAAATLLIAYRNARIGAGAHGIGSAALLGSWCGLLVNSFVVDTLHWRHLWLVAALIWADFAHRAHDDRIPPQSTDIKAFPTVHSRGDAR